MAFASNLLPAWPLPAFASGAVAVYFACILLVIAVIGGRRLVRKIYFLRRDTRAYQVRQQWSDILSGAIPPSKWRNSRLDREVIENILLDSIEAANPEELPPLHAFLRASGLLDMRLHDARATTGWNQRSALVALGRTRIREAFGPLVDALNSPDIHVRTAAVRGLGEIGLVEAAGPILERLATGELNVPQAVISTALVQCCATEPRRLLRYIHLTAGQERELLARVLAEADLSSLGEELISLAKDKSPEVRASAARGLPKLHASIAVPVLTELATDESWFVRLRAAVALGSMGVPDAVEPLLHTLCDSNRLVRQRAAAALVRHSNQLQKILENAVALNDNYALQALLSELDRSVESEPMVRAVQRSSDPGLAAAIQRARNELRLEKSGHDSLAAPSQ
ncbi:MAG: HEAT repeat domain-containing protein [Terriglobales bacterium]